MTNEDAYIFKHNGVNVQRNMILIPIKCLFNCVGMFNELTSVLQ